MKTVAIIGIGLIGGSLAKDFRNYGISDNIIGVDKNIKHAHKAIELGIVNEILPLEQACEKADVIILATPVNIIQNLLPSILDNIKPDQIVMDVGSTKEKIVETVENHPCRGQFVATHPMAGTEYSGPEAAINDLFNKKCLVICNREKSNQAVLETVEEMYRKIGMSIVYHEAKDHDIHCAYVSHISHISSFALALTVLEKEKNETRIFELAGGGFSSTVRLAKSEAETWIPIFEINRDNVLDVLDEHINTISQFRTMLIKKDFKKFREKIIEANKIQKILK